MATGSPLVAERYLKFRPSPSPDVAGYRIRIRGANTVPARDEPYDDVPAVAPKEDGYVYYPISGLVQAQGLEGLRDVHITARDGVGNESGFLEVDNQLFDFSPPEAPTEGSIV